MDSRLQAISDTLPLLQTQLDTDSSLLKQNQDGFSQFQKDVVAGRKLTVLSNLQLYPLGKESQQNWTDAGGQKADTNPAINTTPHGTLTYPPGFPSLFSASPAAPYDNFFLFLDLPLPSSRPTSLADIRRYDGLIVANHQGLEMDFQLTWNGVTHNMAWQFNFFSNQVRYFNHRAQQWVATSIPLPDFSQSVSIAAEYQLDDSNTTHSALTLNGITYPVNVIQPGTPTAAGNKFTMATQLDSRNPVHPLSVKVGKVEVRYL